MRQTQATLIKKETIAPAWWQLTLAAPDIAARLQPGQFLLVRCSDIFSSYLRRPIFPQAIDERHLTLLLRPTTDPGLSWLLARQINDTLDLIGPLGSGFTLPPTTQNLLLASDSQLMAPLLGQMRRAIAAGCPVTLVQEGARATTLYPPTALPPAVEVHTATRDGSLGHHGAISDLLPRLLRWADIVCAVGSMALYQMLQTQAAGIRFGPQTGYLYGLLAQPSLACGVGACFGCTIQSKQGLQLTCLDGPVFDLGQLQLGGTA